MKKIGVLLILAILGFVGSCTSSKDHDYRFDNQSSYLLHITPENGQTWDAFTLTNTIAHEKVITISDEAIYFSYDNASFVDASGTSNNIIFIDR